MKADYELLAGVFGTVEALFQLPFLRVLGDAGTTMQEQWQVAYHRRGLPLGKDRQTVERLRSLTAAGLLTTTGETMGRSWRLTTNGVFSAMAALDLPTANCRDLLSRIIELQAESTVPNPYSRNDGRLAMVWYLMPTAGFWLQDASRTDKTWAAYQTELARLCNWLIPLAILGHVVLYHDGRGQVWGARVTEAGRAAADEWPDHPQGFDGWQTGHAECDRCFDSWLAGFDEGLARYESTPAPKEYQNIVPCRLPHSAWWK